MASATQNQAAQSIDAHARAIDELHHTLAQMPGVDKERLQKAAEKFKSAHQQFRDDALACMN
jgi:hypothetical protein